MAKWPTNKAQTIIKGASSINRFNRKYHGNKEIKALGIEAWHLNKGPARNTIRNYLSTCILIHVKSRQKSKDKR